ncbi:MAG: NAD-binding protein [Candidatus Competibacteraceae bacterium]|nr:NAD-binding protein [Candidatus Competibacteraceae bacterium]MBK7985278.1 NAD-binding protein [Candidatus Competibacteraceae bacterium]MBK8895646.1 NAD-binding protein [Candidatus Competibacteraceae bacterium]MBK8962738.1 NAD-binding protein [Candidatus Competibacteraceae bacterium]MBK9953332.1 NAD-binding protein [Candidatus Competibacteraceae bacterium]
MLYRFQRSTRRLLALLALLPAAVLVLGSLYMLGMHYLEGNPRGFWASLEWASETLTTTGYGADARWSHPLMTLFVMLTQFIGMFLVFMIFPIYVLPYFEERFEARLPRVLPPMAGRTLFYRYGPAIDSLLEECQRIGSAFVIFEEDMALARNLRERDYPVVYGSLDEDPEALAGVEQAQAVVTNADDHANATCILVVRERGFEGPVYALADNPLYRPPMLKVGASAVFTPTHVLGAALAARASTRINPPAEGLHLLGAQVDLAEFRVRADSPLAGQLLGDLHLRERHGVTVIGQWHSGRFTTVKGPHTRIEPGAILVAVGTQAHLVQVERLAAPIRRTGPIVVAGYGTVGGKVVEMLRDARETTTVIDGQLAPGVDVVGNVLEHTTLEQANVRAASAVVLALSNDSEGVFATAVVRDYAPEVPLIVRVNRAPNVPRLYQAGADFALSVGQVAGEILAYHLLGEQAVAVEQRLKFMRLGAGLLAGLHPWRAQVRERTGAAVIAVERGQDVFVKFDDEFRVRADDVLFVCGTLGGLDKYAREFKATPI